MEENRASGAFVDQAPVAFEAAVAQAARLIRASALPTFAHLGADVDGAREAVWLAEAVGGVLDHAHSDALLKDLDPVRESGAMQTTPLEAAIRADVALWVGDGAAPDWLARPVRPHGEEVARRVLRLGSDITGVGAARLGYLAALRARAKGAPARAPEGVEAIAAALRAAKFGVALWDAAELEPLAIETLHGLVRDLNEITRFSTLATPAPENGEGVQAALGWMTGFPARTSLARTSLARGYPEHDPWRFDARRLAASGESDCLIWVSAFADGAPPPGPVAIALGAGAEARVRFAVAAPGADSDAILYDTRTGALTATCAAAPSNTPTVAQVLAAIRAACETA